MTTQTLPALNTALPVFSTRTLTLVGQDLVAEWSCFQYESGGVTTAPLFQDGTGPASLALRSHRTGAVTYWQRTQHSAIVDYFMPTDFTLRDFPDLTGRQLVVYND